MEFTAADATAISQSTLQSDIAIAVAKKMQDQQKQQGAAALSLLADAAAIGPQPIHPGKGLTLDATG